VLSSAPHALWLQLAPPHGDPPPPATRSLSACSLVASSLLSMAFALLHVPSLRLGEIKSRLGVKHIIAAHSSVSHGEAWEFNGKISGKLDGAAMTKHTARASL
jgi:hypothetical protein